MDGCGCGGDRGVGLTRMSYLRGAGAAGAPWIATAVAAEVAGPTAGAAVGSAARGPAGGGAAVGGPSGGRAASAGEGEEGCTRGLWLELCPPWVLAMLRLGKEWVGRRGFLLKEISYGE